MTKTLYNKSASVALHHRFQSDLQEGMGSFRVEGMRSGWPYNTVSLLPRHWDSSFMSHLTWSAFSKASFEDLKFFGGFVCGPEHVHPGRPEESMRWIPWDQLEAVMSGLMWV